MIDEEACIRAAFIAAIIALFIGVAAGHSCGKSEAADTLGTKSAPCFANYTCRDGLTCLHGDGLEPGACVAQ